MCGFCNAALPRIDVHSHALVFVFVGKVQLLTHPMAAGYMQNPISVYYCYSAAGKLSTCIAEVTNTPWCVSRHPNLSVPLPRVRPRRHVQALRS